MAWASVYYATATASADVTDGTDNNDTLSGSAPGAGTVSASLSGGETADVTTFTTVANDPNLTTWQAGDYVAQVGVSSLGANVTWGIEINRVNSSGTNIENLADSTITYTTASTQTLTWTNASDKTVSAGDRIQIVVKGSRSASHGNQALDVSIGVPSEATTTKLTIPASTTDYTMTADPGTYSISGTAATFDTDMSAGGGSYSVSGTDITTDTDMSAGSGSYSLSGTDATFDITFNAESGTYSYNGTAITFDYTILAEGGTYTINGTDVTLEDTVTPAGVEYTLQDANENGLDISFEAVGSADKFYNTTPVFMLVKNGSGGDLQITVVTQVTSFTDGSYGKLEKNNRVLTIANGAEAILGPFPRRAYNDVESKVNIQYDQTSGVTAASIRIKNT